MSALFLAAGGPRRPADDAPVILRPGVVLLPVDDGSARLLDMGGRFYAVSAPAAELLREAMRVGPGRAARAVAGRYGVASDRVRDDLAALLDQLRGDGVLGPAGRRRPGARIAAAVLAPIVRRLASGGGRREARAAWLLALARVSFRVLGWEGTVAAWRSALGPHPRPAPAAAGADLVGDVDRAVRAAASGHLLRVECKERAICCWTLLRAAGRPATLVVGVNTFPLQGHCWCEADGRVLSDYPDRCAEFARAASYC